jgi:serine/threonine protein kinase
MDTLGSEHPSDHVLRAYGIGKLHGGLTDKVHAHLEFCAGCRQRVSELSADSFLGRMREAQIQSESPAPAGPSFAGISEVNEAASSSSASAARSVPTGLVEHPDYEVLGQLGRGGMGVVYLARNKLMDRKEVLKVVSRELMDRRGVLDRFLREIRSAAQLHHSNIVSAYSAFRAGESIVFAMEYVEGQDLASYVRTQGPLPVVHAAYFTYQAALGLQYAHEKGLVHRDIKPSNLILAREGRRAVVKVLDFGLAKATREGPVDKSLTHEGQMLGTPDYIAPEQSLDATKADIRADIYSLGCTLYYLLSGGPPFGGASLYEVLQAHHSMEAKPLNLLRPEVPIELAAVVAKMMAKDSARRYQTPGEVAKALKPFYKTDESRSSAANVEASRAVASSAAPNLASAGAEQPQEREALEAYGSVARTPVPPPRSTSTRESPDETKDSLLESGAIRSDRTRRTRSLMLWAAVSVVPLGVAGILVHHRLRTQHQLAASGAETPKRQLEVVPAPSVTSVKIDLAFPPYTNVAARTNIEGGRVEAIAGTTVTVHATTNMPVLVAHLDLEMPNASQEPLFVSAADPTALSGTFVVKESGRYFIRFRNNSNQPNPDPVPYDIIAIPDRAPTARFLEPEYVRLRVPANSDLDLVMAGADDHGIKEATLVVTVGNQVLISKNVLEGSRVEPEFRVTETLELERLGIKPGSTLTYKMTIRDNKQPSSNQVETETRVIEVTESAGPAEKQRRDEFRRELRREEQEIAVALRNQREQKPRSRPAKLFGRESAGPGSTPPSRTAGSSPGRAPAKTSDAILAQQPLAARTAHRSKLGEDVEKAIRNGVRYLRTQQRADGSWTEIETEAETGATSLVTLALFSSGEKRGSPPVDKALEYLRRFGPEQLHSTYAIALQTMVFATEAAEPNRDQMRIAANARWLEQAQIKSGDPVKWPGSWTYSTSKRARPGDNSNSQYALVGLQAAMEAGVPVKPEVLARARAYWQTSQNQDGSWAYTPGGSSPRASLTTAGISSLIITAVERDRGQEFLQGDSVQNCGKGGVSRNVQRGVDWLASHFQVNQNFGAGEQWRFYYLYELERASRLAGVRFFGPNDWYRMGAEQLVREQNKLSGIWRGAQLEEHPVLATSFAVLFLARGRAPVLINKLRYDSAGDWRNDPDDIRNLVAGVSRDWKSLLTWQVVDPDIASLPDLLQAPIVFFNGHRAPEFSAIAKQNLREYVKRGGFILADACCDSADFDGGFGQLMNEVFPEKAHQLRPLAENHPIWNAKHQLAPGSYPLYCIQDGTRTVVLYSPKDLSCYWNQEVASPANPAVVEAIKIGQNVVDYVTGRKIPPDKLCEF